MLRYFLPKSVYSVTYLQVYIHSNGITGDIKHDRCACKGGAMGGQGTWAGVLLLDAADIALCQHQHSADVLDATVPGKGEASIISLQTIIPGTNI